MIASEILRIKVPGMAQRRVLVIRRKVLDELLALFPGEAGADADMLERPGIVVKAEQQRADGGTIAFLVPAKAADHAVAFPLVLDLEHRPLVRLVNAGERLGHHSIESRSLEAPEPVSGDLPVAGRGGDVKRRGGSDQ